MIMWRKVNRESVQMFHIRRHHIALLAGIGIFAAYAQTPASSAAAQNLFPDFDDNLRQAFRRETELFFESVIREDRNVLDLLNVLNKAGIPTDKLGDSTGVLDV